MRSFFLANGVCQTVHKFDTFWTNFSLKFWWNLTADFTQIVVRQYLWARDTKWGNRPKGSTECFTSLIKFKVHCINTKWGRVLSLGIWNIRELLHKIATEKKTSLIYNKVINYFLRSEKKSHSKIWLNF